MDNKIFKYIKYLLYVMMILGVGVFVYFLVMSLLHPEQSQYPVGSVGAAKGTGVMLWYTYVLVALALIVALIFPLINIFKNPKGAARSLIGLGIMIVILGVSYLVSSAEPVTMSDGVVVSNALTLRLTDMGLYAAYLVLLATFLAIIGTEIWNAVKK